MEYVPTEGEWVEYIDAKGQKITIPFQEFIQTKTSHVVEADRALGIHRDSTPAVFLSLPPEHPNTDPYMRLATALQEIPCRQSLSLETQDAKHWMRCLQMYWQAKALALAYQIYPLPMPDPMAKGEVIQKKLLPDASFRNIRLDVIADKSWYFLLKAGENHIKEWAKEIKITYPFDSVDGLFLETLLNGFEIELENNLLCIDSGKESKKNKRNHYRQWLGFLRGRYDGEPREVEYERVLMGMEWKGYALLVLRKLHRDKQIGKFWKLYFKAHNPLVELMDNTVFWDDSIPYQLGHVPSTGHRTRRKVPITSFIGSDGLFHWNVSNRL